jgi:alkylation response protein AidB-like acyl-CoA dehydrogenase
MGLRTSPIGDVTFDEVFVPQAAVLGKSGMGLLIFTDVLEWERIWQSAQQIGAMQRDLDAARSYATQRTAFGAPISSFQSISNEIVDMKVRLEAARLLAYRAAWVKTRSGSAPVDAAIAKLYTSESQLQGSLDLLHVHGGYGYLSDAGVERRVRDAAGGRFYAGTSDMLRAVIGRSLRL